MKFTNEQLGMILSSIILKVAASSKARKELKKERKIYKSMGYAKEDNSLCMYAINLNELEKAIKLCGEIHAILVAEINSQESAK